VTIDVQGQDEVHDQGTYSISGNGWSQSSTTNPGVQSTGTFTYNQTTGALTVDVRPRASARSPPGRSSSDRAATRLGVGLGALLHAGTAGAQAAGALAGEVREAATSRVLEGARILLHPGGLAGLTTGPDGRFVFTGLAPGRYRLFASLWATPPDTLPSLEIPRTTPCASW